MLCSYNKVSQRKENVIKKFIRKKNTLTVPYLPKKPLLVVSSPTQFKPVLLKGQLYFFQLNLTDS